MKRYAVIWVPFLLTDWHAQRKPELRGNALVIAALHRGRKEITAVNGIASEQGLSKGMTVADARALVPALQVLDETPELNARLLKAMGEWCIRFTPVVALDSVEGLILDASGCTHLWGGEASYLEDIATRLAARGYFVRIGMADTIGAAWAVSRLGHDQFSIVAPGQHAYALMNLSPAALRLDPAVIGRFHKLGLHRIGDFIQMQRSALRRRFGEATLQRIDQAFGHVSEQIMPLEPEEPYVERLPCLEPIITATGIELAVKRLLQNLCDRLRAEGKGLRTTRLNAYRIDGRVEQLSISTTRASANPGHLFDLFAIKIPKMEPAAGIELFTLDAVKAEDATPVQDTFWNGSGDLENVALAELLDRVAGKMGQQVIHRYWPAEHHWPERAFQPAPCFHSKPTLQWQTPKPRPILLLPIPEPVQVAAPIPDSPPMLFRYKGKVHTIRKADGPERITQEWWIQKGRHRDYYCVEDEEGRRFWLFRSGHYGGNQPPAWFIHGFFA